MLMIPTFLTLSSIHGIGTFALEPIKKGNIIWQFNALVDRVYTEKEYNQIPPSFRKFIDKYGWKIPGSITLYLLPGDNDRFINHSDNPNVGTLDIGKSCFDGCGIALRDIEAGEELTENYREFDKDSFENLDRILKL